MTHHCERPFDARLQVGYQRTQRESHKKMENRTYFITSANQYRDKTLSSHESPNNPSLSIDKTNQKWAKRPSTASKLKRCVCAHHGVMLIPSITPPSFTILPLPIYELLPLTLSQFSLKFRFSLSSSIIPSSFCCYGRQSCKGLQQLSPQASSLVLRR